MQDLKKQLDEQIFQKNRKEVLSRKHTTLIVSDKVLSMKLLSIKVLKTIEIKLQIAIHRSSYWFTEGNCEHWLGTVNTEGIYRT